MEKTKQKYDLFLLENVILSLLSFDLWMSKGAHDVFVLVDWKPKYVTFGLF
jgi:hypothetical protein